MTEYYDLVLGLIPLALVGVAGALHLTGVTLTTAVSLGGLVAIAVVVHALFVRAPVDDAPAASSSSSSSTGPVTAD